MTTSEQLMGARKGRIEMRDPRSIKLFGYFPTAVERKGDSYINLDINMLLQLEKEYGIYHRRAWQKRGSASATASNIKNGKFSGEHGGQPGKWGAKCVKDPIDEDMWTVIIWRAR